MSCYILDKCTCNCLKLSGENPSYFLSSRGRKIDEGLESVPSESWGFYTISYIKT